VSGKRAARVENVTLPASALVPHERNYNRHSDAQINDLRELLRQFGQVRSIVVQPRGKKFVIVAGHGIAQAAQAEGLTQLRADVIPAAWSQTRVLAYLAADNELARHGDPDQDQLAAIVREVMETEGEALARLAAGEQSALDAIIKGIQPMIGEWGDAFDHLPNGDRAPFQQITFTLHDTQAEQVKRALTVSKRMGEFVNSPNENSNGNAIARICETFITEHGNG